MFITFEGIEGAGKTTVIQGIAKILEERGSSVLVTREPGGSTFGTSLRSLLLSCDSDLDELAELYLFLADRAQHVSKVLRPALDRGDIVLCDRYIDSTTAYQGYARGLDQDELHTLNAIASRGLKPDLTLVLDLPVEEGLARAAKRRSLMQSDAEARFDLEKLSFHQAVAAGFHAIAASEPQRVRLVNAARCREEVMRACMAEIDQLAKRL